MKGGGRERGGGKRARVIDFLGRSFFRGLLFDCDFTAREEDEDEGQEGKSIGQTE